MGVPKYPEEFKSEAVRQVTDQNRPVLEVSKGLGISDATLYAWIKKSGKSIGVVKHISSKPSLVAQNHLDRQFAVTKPDEAWVTGITYVRTYQGWLYLAVVIDLYSRMVVGWSMKPNLHRDIALDALIMGLHRRAPQQEVLIHSDQGSQYSSDDWSKLARSNGFKISMSRRGNCWDNACAESFFSSLKKERIRRKIYPTFEDARTDLFDYIELFYNRKRRHSYFGYQSPIEFEAKSRAS